MKRCEDCKNGIFVGPDPSVGINQAWLDDCGSTDPRVRALLNQDLTEEELAEKCPGFDPIMVEKCGECGKQMNVPLHSHTLFAICYESIPVCSVDCKKAAENKFKEAIGEL